MDEIFDATDRVMFKRKSKCRSHELRLDYHGTVYRFFVNLQFFISNFIALGKFLMPKTDCEVNGPFTNVSGLTPGSLHLLVAVTCPTLYGKYPEPITEFNVCAVLDFVERFELYDIGEDCMKVILKTSVFPIQSWFLLFDYVTDSRLDDDILNRKISRKVRTHIMRQALINDSHQVANMCILKYASPQHINKWEQLISLYDTRSLSHEISQLEFEREGNCHCPSEEKSGNLYSDIVKSTSNSSRDGDVMSSGSNDNGKFCSFCLAAICNNCVDQPCDEKISCLLSKLFEVDSFIQNSLISIPCDAWDTKCCLDTSCASSISGDSGFHSFC